MSDQKEEKPNKLEWLVGADAPGGTCQLVLESSESFFDSIRIVNGSPQDWTEISFGPKEIKLSNNKVGHIDFVFTLKHPEIFSVKITAKVSGGTAAMNWQGFSDGYVHTDPATGHKSEGIVAFIIS